MAARTAIMECIESWSNRHRPSPSTRFKSKNPKRKKKNQSTPQKIYGHTVQFPLVPPDVKNSTSGTPGRPGSGQNRMQSTDNAKLQLTLFRPVPGHSGPLTPTTSSGACSPGSPNSLTIRTTSGCSSNRPNWRTKVVTVCSVTLRSVEANPVPRRSLT